MGESTQPIGAPVIRRTEERTYTGPVGWALPTRARDLALVLSVELLSVKATSRSLGTTEQVTVRAAGDVRRLDRYWKRLDEVADAGQSRSPITGEAAGRGARRAGRWTLRGILDSIFSW